MRRLPLTLVALLSLAPAAFAAQADDSGAFVVRRGEDTVLVERFTRSGPKLEGSLSYHRAQPMVEEYTAVIAPDETLPLIEVVVKEPSPVDSSRSRVAQRARVIFKEDSAAVDAVTGTGLYTQVYATQLGAVPYLNLSFALLEQALRRAAALGARGREIPFFNLGGGQTATATVARVDDDTVRLGLGDVEFVLETDAEGHIVSGSIPSQNVRVERVRGS